MRKKYISKSEISVNAVLENKNCIHISFSPSAQGGSVYYTDSPRVQEALERHRLFGKMFKLDKNYIEDTTSIDDADEELNTGEGSENPLIEISVTCLEDAKDYLCDKFGCSRTKLRSVKAIMTTAQEKGISFIGI